MIVTFEKGLLLRHIGHLDLMRAMQRALRRSGLPVQYSKGFNPHINLSFAAPLSVGVVGLNEIMDVPLTAEMDADAFAKQLSSALPDCLRARRARAVGDDFPTLMALVAGSRVRIHLDPGASGDRAAAALADFMARKEYVALRKTKSGENQCDLRVFVQEASAQRAEDGGWDIRCVIVNNPSGSLKPALLMRSLIEIAGVEDAPYLAYREHILARERGRLLPLEESHANA